MGANVVFRNYVLGGILQTAFGMDRLALEAPDWLFNERFDITAKVPNEKATLDERRKMLQALFIDRFGLTFHQGQNAWGVCVGGREERPEIQPVPDEGGHNNDNRPGRLERLRTTIDGFASQLQSVLRQPVVDETHLEGRFNVLLTYAPDRGVSAATER